MFDRKRPQPDLTIHAEAPTLKVYHQLALRSVPLASSARLLAKAGLIFFTSLLYCRFAEVEQGQFRPIVDYHFGKV